MTAAPVIYLSHGAPPLADDERWTAELARWSSELAKPENVPSGTSSASLAERASCAPAARSTGWSGCGCRRRGSKASRMGEGALIAAGQRTGNAGVLMRETTFM